MDHLSEPRGTANTHVDDVSSFRVRAARSVPCSPSIDGCGQMQHRRRGSVRVATEEEHGSDGECSDGVAAEQQGVLHRVRATARASGSDVVSMLNSPFGGLNGRKRETVGSAKLRNRFSITNVQTRPIQVEIARDRL